MTQTGMPVRSICARVICPKEHRLHLRSPIFPPGGSICASMAQRLRAGMRYSRYVDDLFFSTGVASPGRHRRFVEMVYTIVLEEGFEPNYRKTRYMPRARAQRAAGLVVNVHPNVSRAEFDRLKATLTNCERLGPASQNRHGHDDFRAHLLGRVGFCEQVNRLRGSKLRRIFDRIRWPSPEPERPVG